MASVLEMKKQLTLGVVASLLISTLYGADSTEDLKIRNASVRDTINNFGKIEDKEVSEVNKMKKIFRKGKVSGQLKLMYSQAAQPGDAYATAIGGIIKYELAEYQGFNAGAAVYTSHDIPFASGDGVKRSTEMSSESGNHTEMSEAFLNYKYNDFNFRAGRQVLDTPLADTDNIRMIQNTFEAYAATYNLKGFKLMVGNIQTWHGTDAGLENGWSKTGTKGTNFGGVAYADGLELNAWYYNITGMTNAVYLDLGIEYQLRKNVLLHLMAQYLNQSELENSGIEASIYGALAEVVVYDIGLRLAINKADRKRDKKSFSGFGGGALFTNMDTMIIDVITQDREALSYALGLFYSYDNFELLYVYSDFNGQADSNGDTAHIVEQNVGLGYDLNAELMIGVVFAAQNDKEESSNDWTRAQVMLNYNF